MNTFEPPYSTCLVACMCVCVCLCTPTRVILALETHGVIISPLCLKHQQIDLRVKWTLMTLEVMEPNYWSDHEQCIHVTTVNKDKLAKLYLFKPQHGNNGFGTLQKFGQISFF